MTTKNNGKPFFTPNHQGARKQDKTHKGHIGIDHVQQAIQGTNISRDKDNGFSQCSRNEKDQRGAAPVFKSPRARPAAPVASQMKPLESPQKPLSHFTRPINSSTK